MKRNSFLFIIIVFLSCCSCSKKKDLTIKNDKTITILVQPFKDMNYETTRFVSNEIKKIYPNIKILDAIDLPKESYYKERNRYRADSIIKYLSKNTTEGFVTIGLTTRDISTTKGSIKDFGVMGLGFKLGKSCIASNFRLSKSNKNEQFFKVAIHEIGHTQGLKHCPEKSCFMRDAEGKNFTDEETDFCNNCKNFFKN
ncbi:matrixin family metalloprotease [Chryseobacterium indoltheticum]|uniref:matrixin family metalloprotease n=1 Tax=Chryseobacterium indoltheticum TaxID=254 RepID=UPI003F499F54